MIEVTAKLFHYGLQQECNVGDPKGSIIIVESIPYLSNLSADMYTAKHLFYFREGAYPITSKDIVLTDKFFKWFIGNAMQANRRVTSNDVIANNFEDLFPKFKIKFALTRNDGDVKTYTYLIKKRI